MRTLFAILSLFVISLYACSSKQTVADKLVDASDAIMNKDYNTAGDICRQILDEQPLNTISAAELCEMSLILIKVSEHVEAEDNAAAAVRCFSHVMTAKPDSATIYFNALPSEDFQYVFLLKNLNTSLTAATDTASFPEE